MPFIIQQLSADGVTSDGRVVLATAVLEAITNDHVATIAINAGGSGYAVGDEIRLNTGTPISINGDSFHATARVTSEAAGVITGLELVSAGSYPSGTLPTATGGATTTLTGAGSGATVDVTTVAANWTEDERNNLDNIDFQTDGDWLVTSTKASNAPTIGMRSNASGAFDAVQLMIASSYSAALPWRDQPGNPPNSDFWLSCPNQNPTIYLSTTERRVNLLITNSALVFRQYGGSGLFIPFVDVDSNYPFPAICHAQSTSIRDFTETFNASNRGVIHPINFGSPGCYQYRDNLSPGWFGLTEDNGSGSQAGAGAVGVVWPNQGLRAEYSFNKAPVPVNGVGSVDSNDMTPGAGVNGATNYPASYGSFNEANWFAVDSESQMSQGIAPFGLGSQLHFTVQSHIIAVRTNDCQMIGIIDGFEEIHMRGLSDFDEVQSPDGRRYIVFSDTGASDLHTGVAMEII